MIPKDEDIQQRLIQELHSTHPGIVKMKALARSYIWWPAIDKTLEHYVRTCIVCQDHQHAPQQAPIHPWEFPERPWSRLHIDYATIENQEVLIVVDAHSKWIDAIRVNKATASATVTAIRRLFATHGIADTVVSDNGTQFISEEFEKFLSNNNVEHVQTAPHHPSSNGLAERAVQTVKRGVKKTSGNTLELRLQKFLLTYRITPQSTTGKCPSELMFKRTIRSRLDHVRPNLNKSVKKQQSSMKARSDKRKKQREYDLLDSVIIKNFAAGPIWLHGQIVEILTESMYVIELNDGRLVRRHVDHIRKTEVEEDLNVRPQFDTPSSGDRIEDLPQHQQESRIVDDPTLLVGLHAEPSQEELARPIPNAPAMAVDTDTSIATPPSPQNLRKSTRPRKPVKFTDFVV